MRKKVILAIGVIGMLVLTGTAILTVASEQSTNTIQITRAIDKNVVNFGEIIDTEIAYQDFLFLKVPYPDSSVEKTDIDVDNWDNNDIRWEIKMTVAPFSGTKFIFPINMIFYTVNFECGGSVDQMERLVTNAPEEISYPVTLENVEPGDTYEVKISVKSTLISNFLGIPLFFLGDPDLSNNECICTFTAI